MEDRLRITILGCGSSPGTPRITGDWGACDPKEPRNRRTRCSALFERIGTAGTTAVVVDCGPDFREQMLAAKVRRLDAVIITHPHADHFHGLDDIRGFYLDNGRCLDLFADEATYLRVNEAFGYCFQSPSGSSYPPIVRWRSIKPPVAIVVEGLGGPLTMIPFEQEHGSIKSLGFRIGPVAYCSDVSGFPLAAQNRVSGAELLIIDALQYRTHPSHLSVDQALHWIQKLNVPRAILTHMHTPLDYQTLRAELPKNVSPAFDGMTIEFAIL